MGSELQHYTDAAMFEAESIKKEDETGISVHLLWMTPDPLGAIAAACRMYEGKPTYSLEDITNEEREHYFEQVQKTHLKAPLEFVKFHFFVEGVDRALTHQMVRQRTAVYAQESMRFAVKSDMAEEVTLPPSIPAGSDNEDVWNNALHSIQGAYDYLIANGVPAEDARGLMPHATPTRLNYSTDLRSMLDHAGNRLCTQAQFAWRIVWTKIRQAIRNYAADEWSRKTGGHPDDIPEPEWEWQFYKLSELLLPVCYQLGKCPFKAKFDRGCTIRERVDLFEEHSVPSSEWGKHHVIIDNEMWSEQELIDAEMGPEPPGHPFVPAIRTEEWLADHKAAHVRVGDEYGDQSRR